MKANKLALVILIITCSIIACNKEGAVNNTENTSSISNSVAASACDLFAYPDTIFYPKQSASDYIVNPINVQDGKYGSFPDVLKIDRNSGAINITKSETGLKYVVWFIPKGTKDTCKKFLTISGINYADSIYTAAAGLPLSIPVYNANTQAPIACNGTCEFGKELISQGIAIDQSTGVINLKQSLLNGALGKNPKNGTFKDFLMQYHIGDQSAGALNSISFRLYYYKLKSQVPDSLVNILNQKSSQVFLQDDTDPDDDNLAPRVNITNITSKQGEGPEVKCRPPYIIVTQK